MEDENVPCKIIWLSGNDRYYDTDALIYMLKIEIKTETFPTEMFQNLL